MSISVSIEGSTQAVSKYITFTICLREYPRLTSKKKESQKTYEILYEKLIGSYWNYNGVTEQIYIYEKKK